MTRCPAPAKSSQRSLPDRSLREGFRLQATGFRMPLRGGFGNWELGIGYSEFRIPNPESLFPCCLSLTVCFLSHRTKSDRSTSPSLIEKSERRRFPLPGFSSMKIMDLWTMCRAGYMDRSDSSQTLRINQGGGHDDEKTGRGTNSESRADCVLPF